MIHRCPLLPIPIAPVPVRVPALVHRVNSVTRCRTPDRALRLVLTPIFGPMCRQDTVVHPAQEVVAMRLTDLDPWATASLVPVPPLVHRQAR